MGADKMKRETKQTVIMITLTLAVLLIMVELCSFLVINRLSFFLPRNEEQDEPRASMLSLFSHDLGWEPRYPNKHGYRGKPKNVEKAAVSLFGDSFTKGHPDIARSWAGLLEQKIGRPVLNFGVGGYGTDQAYLRFEKRYVGKVQTPYVLLGIMSENIARVVNRYRGFYMRRSNLYFTKPRFDLDQEDRLVLVPNPIRTGDELALLDNMDFLRNVGKGDYWYGYYDRYNLNRHAGFPFSCCLIPALPYYVGYYYDSIVEKRMDYFDLYEDPDARSILEQIIFRFIRRAEDNGAVPIILFFPNSLDMMNYSKNGKTVYQGFYRKIRGRHPLTFDALSYFLPHLEQGDEIVSFFRSRSDGHYGQAGEAIVAAGIHADLLDADRERKILNTD